ncbi:Uncharacterised protein [uncultured archaeon]|nr:Uncharacterised protein [uncultured archaeon]
MDAQIPAQAVQPTQSPVPARRLPRFKRDLLEKESFVDPAAEAKLLVPEKTVVASLSSQLVLEGQLPAQQMELSIRKERKGEAFFYSVYEYLLSLFDRVKKRLRGRKAQKRLTAKGEQALEQLRYLALLCDATECRTPEEILAAESAFGEAYYEIKTLSSNLETMREEEQAHHVERYSRHFSRLLSAAQS